MQMTLQFRVMLVQFSLFANSFHTNLLASFVSFYIPEYTKAPKMLIVCLGCAKIFCYYFSFIPNLLSIYTPLFQFKRPDKDLMFILVKKFQLKNKVFFFKETNSKAAKLFNNPTGLQKTERSCKGMVALRLWRWMDPHIFSQYLSRVYKRQRHKTWGIIQGSDNKKHGWGELNKYFDLQRIGVKFKLNLSKSQY